jgi:hypothetical protein
MELIKSVTQRNKLSELAYVLLNLAYAFMVFLLVIWFDNPYLAFLVVFLSKWRVFAVRPRFWLANIQTNLVDFLMGIAVTTVLWQSSGNLPLQLGITAMFAVWLILLKPQSKRIWVIIQSAIVQLVALGALFNIAHLLPVFFVALLGGGIGYVVARHAIHSYGEELEDVTLALIWGLVVAELSWLTYYRTIAYTSLKITQISIIVTLLGYMALAVYSSLYHQEQGHKVRRDIAMPIIFSLIGIGLLLVFFNGFDPTSL